MLRNYVVTCLIFISSAAVILACDLGYGVPDQSGAVFSRPDLSMFKGNKQTKHVDTHIGVVPQYLREKNCAKDQMLQPNRERLERNAN